MKRFFLCLTVAVLNLAGAGAGDELVLDPHFEPLKGLLGKTWKGSFANARPDQPRVDIMKWERILNGQAIRVLHSINEGFYGGETIIRWDKEKQTLAYHYFTTSGFMSTGTMEIKGQKVITREMVEGNSEGITEVRGGSEFLPDGGFRVKSEYLKKGEWVPGHEVTYREDSSAKVVFR